jgi:hypothetical protein
MTIKMFSRTAPALILALAVLALRQNAGAIDAPHNTAGTNTDCTQCHIPLTQPTPWDNITLTGDNTKFNLLCSDCHNNPGDNRVVNTKYRNIKTHSAATTGSAYGNGTWTTECIDCHNPHYQRQARAWQASGYLETGITSKATTSIVLTDESKNWTPGQWKNYLLVPNRTYPTLLYQVSDNTATTITIKAAQSGITSRYSGNAGASYGLKYGKLVSDSVTGSATAASVRFLGN